ncbi:hypothetical protein [Marinicella litoralis]|uniref:Uncharacterized protein n=1 Tax=Marinicella litoralis TaxID=644220 RepID=A0A4R6XTK4_9GAMM|nr:hypothetical protein [Marinicella litoralis]TDR23295.1 hypothetical protein C8D91_0155 [Marinicella litoralis]
MNHKNRAEKTEQAYKRIAWSALMVGVVVLNLLLSLHVSKDSAEIISMINSVLIILVSVMMILAVISQHGSVNSSQTLLLEEPQSHASEMLNKAISISWGFSMVTLVAIKMVSTYILSTQLSGDFVFYAVLGLMLVSYSLSYLFLTAEGYDQHPDEECD